ncbi:lysine 6-dehydrogenase [bacterium BMS3Abin03]|nr:lysine 6-dehydrogenase [bacterium BMS3Abin03]
MSKSIIVLGGGMVGSAIAVDLHKEFNVTVADVNSDRLNKLQSDKTIKTIQKDLSDADTVKEIVKDFDLVIGAVPGFMGYKTLHSVIDASKDVVDISFFSEDPFELDELAKEKNVTAVVDCGVSPGLSNIILGFHNRKMKIESYKCYVGGLPFKRELPFQYKAFFSPIDVIEEYVRPARIVENGKVIIKEALSEPEIIEFEKVGKLEAFNTDGLRTLITTMKIPDMIEKTLRYPGHIALMKVFREAGFFSDKEIEINGNKIKPVELTAKLLFPFWKPEENEDEFTILRIIIEGTENGEKIKYTYNLFDKFDNKLSTSSMARTTGYTCTSAARLLLNGSFKRKGISPPEFIGETPGCFEKVIGDLSNRNIKINVRSI